MDPNGKRPWPASWTAFFGRSASPRIGTVLLVTLLAWPQAARAHSGTFTEISLDEDPRLKAAVVRVAQQFLRTQARPVGFDSINGKIGVNFDPQRRRVVLVDYLAFGTTGRVEIAGFKDEGRRSPGGSPRITADAARARAAAVLRRLPRPKQQELVFDDVTEFGGLYHVRWVRQVRGILVMGNEDFSVGVDQVSGSVVYWEAGIFDFPATMIDVTPTVGLAEAVRRARETASLEFGETMHPTEDFRPVLLLYGREPRWAMRLTNGKPGTANASQYVLVPAREGEVLFKGPRDPELETLPRRYVEEFVPPKP